MNYALRWYIEATNDERRAFLEQIGGYPVSEETYYVHPTDTIRKPEDQEVT